MRLHQFWSKSLARYVPWICAVRGGIRKGDILVADIEELETMDASENPCEKTQCKGSVNTQRWWTFRIPDRRWKRQVIKPLGRGRHLRTSTLIRDRPDRGEEQENLRGESDGSSSNPFQDSSPCDGEATKDFWVHHMNLYSPSSRWTEIQTVRAERSIFPDITEIYWRNQDYK